MNRTTTLLLTGAGTGAALMYFLDPLQGARRRAQARDQVTKLRHDAVDFSGKAWRDLVQRTRGVAAEARHRLHSGEPVDDETLTARVRSRLGHVVSHPRAIEVLVEQGRVTLRGEVPRVEQARLLRAVRAIPGVREVRDEMLPHVQTADVPALQGGGPSRSGRS